MSQQFDVPLKRLRFGQTMRKDAWWVQPFLTFLGLSAFVVYATWAALQGENYWHGNYLSPFYAPTLFGDTPHAWFGAEPGWWPSFLPYSPAILILWAPVGFRMTCYYYRGAYYKAFWASPPACSVGKPHASYGGEKTFPLVIQNLHRFFLYVAILFIGILSYDAWKAMWFVDPATGAETFGIGVGTLVLSATAFLLAGYTFGCHSFRHLVGGRQNKLSGSPVQKACYLGASKLNRRHALWAWGSLIMVAFADLYVRLLATGTVTDWRII
jgi:hypothetical protein